MLFNREYDDSLWLLLSGGKVNIDWILSFVNCIPEELLDSFQKSFSFYLEYKEKHGTMEIQEKLSNKVRTEDDMIYWYSIDEESGILEIGETFTNEEEYINSQVIRLYPLDVERLKKMQTYEELVLGEYIYAYIVNRDEDYENVVVDESLEFSLIKYPFNKLKVETTEILPRYRQRKRTVNVESIPSNITKGDLIRENFDRKIIRKRIKNSK